MRWDGLRWVVLGAECWSRRKRRLGALVAFGSACRYVHVRHKLLACTVRLVMIAYPSMVVFLQSVSTARSVNPV